jgi:hypothetical protein
MQANFSLLHNHGQLNAMMRKAIGGELVKWNATRFGTNYMFLDSMYRMLKDAFERMTDVESAVQALQDTEVFRMKHGDYGSEMPQRMATDPKTTPCKRSSQKHLILSATRIYCLHNRLHMQRPGG